MKNQILQHVLPAILASLFFSSCLIPVNSSFESAELLERGESELTASFGSYADEKFIGREIGVRYGYGITDNFDLKARIVRQSFPRTVGDGSYVGDIISDYNVPQATYFAITPKFNLWRQRLSMTVPVAAHWGRQQDGEVISIGYVSPRILYSFIRKERFDMTASAKLDLGFGIVPGGSLNLGFKPFRNDRVKIQAEIGIFPSMERGTRM